jgi:hypothetical protein
MEPQGTFLLAELSEALFASPLQQSDCPSTEQVRCTALAWAARLGCSCAELVAQEAGDRPECFVTRMRWAIREVTAAFQPLCAA